MQEIQASDIHIAAAFLAVWVALSLIVSHRALRLGRREGLWFNLSMILTPLVAWLLLKRLGISDDHQVCRGCGTVYPKCYEYCLGCWMHYADPVEFTIEGSDPGKAVPEDNAEEEESTPRL